MNKNLRYRMIGLVPYNISPIQQAIQFGHAVVEYGLYNFKYDDYQQWAKNDKTFIILNGGTTNSGHLELDGIVGKGTLNCHLDTLQENKIPVAIFHEPDLGDQLTAVVFLVDERVWDKETYPDYLGEFNLDGTPLNQGAYDMWLSLFSDNKEEADKIAFLRTFLKQFRFA